MPAWDAAGMHELLPDYYEQVDAVTKRFGADCADGEPTGVGK